jgi:hypothetical protein
MHNWRGQLDSINWSDFKRIVDSVTWADFPRVMISLFGGHAAEPWIHAQASAFQQKWSGIGASWLQVEAIIVDDNQTE